MGMPLALLEVLVVVAQELARLGLGLVELGLVAQEHQAKEIMVVLDLLRQRHLVREVVVEQVL
jgi:hypothetical protein